MSRLAARVAKSILATSGSGRAFVDTKARVPQLHNHITDLIKSSSILRNRFFDFEQIDRNVFRATNLTTSAQQSENAAYGGLVVAQAVSAAESTVPHSFKPNSIHAYFISNVDTTVPVDYEVRLIRDSRSFCTRSVDAIQNGQVVFTLQSSFHVVEPDSCVHQSSYPTVIKPPSECPDYNEVANDLQDKLRSGFIKGSENTRTAIVDHSKIDQWLFDMRCTDTESLFGLGESPSYFHFWIRSKIPLSTVDERLHRWLVIYASDASPYTAIFRPHTKNDFAPSMAVSLDHVMYFHQYEIKADEWLLYEVESPTAGAGRGFTQGRIWGTDGKLLISFTQEALVRTRGEVSRQ